MPMILCDCCSDRQSSLFLGFNNILISFCKHKSEATRRCTIYKTAAFASRFERRDHAATLFENRLALPAANYMPPARPSEEHVVSHAAVDC